METNKLKASKPIKMERNLIKLVIRAIIRYIKYGDSNSEEYWDDNLRRYKNYGRAEHYSYFFEILPTRKKFSLLDVGCAVGDGCALIKKNFPKADINGADQSSAGIKIAKEKNPLVRYIHLNILKEEPIGHYNYITLIDTLEHFYNPFLVLNKCLKHADSVILRVPYRQKLPFKKFRHHKYRFSRTTFKDYNHKVIKITKDPDVSGDYIIFQIFGKNNKKT